MAELTPMMQQYMDTKAQYPDAILFYRLGDFYEMFFDDAKLVSMVLELTLTGKDCGLEERAPMCGVPFHSAETYIARLVANGHKVVICEQVENPKDAKGLVRREVVRILTPGTVTDTEMLNESKNNYLCAVYCHEDAYAVCFADVSTGDFHTTAFCDEYRADHLQNELATYVPKEILLYRGTQNTAALERFCHERLHAGVELGYGNYFIMEEGSEVTDDHVYVNQLARIPCVDIINYDPVYENSSFGPTWHTVNDNISNIDRNTLKAVGQTVMDVIYNEK